jgi:hypothetical protein
MSFHRLITVDRPEAVGNVETALNAKLNAFHSLADSMQQNLGGPVDWYETPELCTILAIRNARHHNKASRIRSLYNFHVQMANAPTDLRCYLYVDFPSSDKEDGGDFFDLPISWLDLDTMLSLPRQESRLRPEVKERVRAYLNADAMEAEAERRGFDRDQIFINFVPLAMNAGIALFPYLRDHVEIASTEAKAFLGLFESTCPASTTDSEYQLLEFMLPE